MGALAAAQPHRRRRAVVLDPRGAAAARERRRSTRRSSSCHRRLRGAAKRPLAHDGRLVARDRRRDPRAMAGGARQARLTSRAATAAWAVNRTLWGCAAQALPILPSPPPPLSRARVRARPAQPRSLPPCEHRACEPLGPSRAFPTAPIVACAQLGGCSCTVSHAIIKYSSGI